MSARNFSAFAHGYGLGQQMVKDYRKEHERRKLAEVAAAKPEHTKGFTGEQGEQLRAAAESGQYDVGWDEGAKAYKVTPKADPNQSGMIEQGAVTDFLGARTPGTMSSEDVATARQMAMAGIIGQNDPVRAMEMERGIERDKRDRKVANLQMRDLERRDREGQAKEDNQKFMTDLEAQVGEFMRGRVGPDGKPKMEDLMAAQHFKAGRLIEAGKTEEAGKIVRELDAQAFTKIQLDGARRDQSLQNTIAAVNAGDLDAVTNFHNEFLADGSTVTRTTRGKNGEIIIEREGVNGPLPPHTFKDMNHLIASLASLKDPMKVYEFTQSEMRANLAQRADRRAAAAEARAGRAEQRQIEEQERQRKAEQERQAAGVNLYQQQNPGASGAEIEAVRTGVMPAVPAKGGYKTEAGDITSLLGDPAVDSKGQPLMDPLTGRQAINRNPDRERALFQFMAKHGITDTNEGIQKFLLTNGQGGAPAAGANQQIARGQVVDGYEYLGGDPKNPKSWRQVSAGQVR